jgi:hypothetical protein
MQASWADTLWLLMAEGEYYSIQDLINISGQPGSIVTDIVNFLTKYGFVKEMGATEPLFTRSSIVISPTLSMNILQCIANE